MLPQVAGVGGGSALLPASVEILRDMYGKGYANVSLATGWPPLPVNFAYREGYVFAFYQPERNRGELTTEDALVKSITSFGWDAGLSLLAGAQYGTPLPALEPDFVWFSVGASAGVSGSIGFTFGPIPFLEDRTLSWDWENTGSEHYDMSSINTSNSGAGSGSTCNCGP